jgi:hypothetical protein
VSSCARVVTLISTLVVTFLAAVPCSSQDTEAQTPAGGTSEWRRWGSSTDSLTTGRPGERLVLTSPFIEAGSEVVFVGGVRLDPDQYEFNYQRGTIRILTPLAEGTAVKVSYRRLPFLLNSVYTLRNVEFSDIRPPIPETRPPRKREGFFNPTGDLVFGGMKSISLSFGTDRGTSLDQTLRATVEGQLTANIRVRALLSDDNLPIQPEGNTEELEYIDKVFVEISGPNGKATLGDFGISNAYSDFNNFRRELKGVSGELTGFDSRVGASAGSAKGEFRTLSFRGTEQLQGPYDLLPPGRINGEVIIAGTERVFFDGTLLQRGQNRDYTINYDRGTITFTPRRLVTADTEIAVDFEATQERYNRTSTFGLTETQKLPGQFSFNAVVGVEEDDDSRPKNISLDEQERNIISAAGDDQQAAIAPGVTFVGVGEGHYEAVPADTVTGVPLHYAFNDSTGAYDVVFVEVGGGSGDYVLDGITAGGLPIYSFAGVAKGNYAIGKLLPLPQSHKIVSTRLKRDGRVQVDAQYNVSDFDRNTLSTLDNDDNIGDAGELRLGLVEIPVGVGVMDIHGSVSTIEENFRSLDRTRTPYFYRDWNLERDALVGREILQNLRSTFRREDAVRLDYDLGLLRRDNFDGIKNEGRVALAQGEDRRLDARVFDTTTDGDNQERTRTHGNVTVGYGVWKTLPSVWYEAEEFLTTSPTLPDSGIAYDRYGARLATRKLDRFGYSVDFEQRNTQTLADTTNGWIDARVDRTFRAGLIARRTRGVQGELEFTHRVQDNKTIGARQTADLARLKGRFQARSIGLLGNIDYEISQNQFRTQQKSVVFVGEGQGDYNELGEPVGKGRGSYTLVLLPTLETTPTSTVNLAFRLHWKMGRTETGGTWGWIARNVSLDQQLVIRDESTSDDAYKLYLLFPSELQRNDTTVRGLVSLRQAWSLLEGSPTTGLTFRYERDDEEDNSFVNVKENKFFQRQIGRVERSVTTRLSANAEVTREVRRRNGQGLQQGTGSTYDVEGWSLSGGWGLRFGGGNSFDGVLVVGVQSDDESGAEERSISLKPRFVWRVTKVLNLFGRYEVTRYAEGSDTLVRPFFFSAPGTTHRWSLTPNLKVSRFISVVSTYEGRSEDTFLGNRITEHDFRIETRAFF